MPKTVSWWTQQRACSQESTAPDLPAGPIARGEDVKSEKTQEIVGKETE